jgi:hypothetical protein
MSENIQAGEPENFDNKPILAEPQQIVRSVRRYPWWIWPIVALVVMLPFVGWCINPMHRPEPVIRAELLFDVPRGSSKQQVKDYLIAHGHKREDFTYSEANNTLHCRLGEYWGSPMTICCTLGICSTTVAADWVFDKNDQLIDVVVKKEIDAL